MIETERLELRPWRLEEVDRLFDIRSRPTVAKWLGVPQPWTSIGQARDAVLDWADVSAAADPFGTWAIVDGETRLPLGSVNVGELPDSTEIQIGWLLHPDSVGSGYASEAAAAVLADTLAQGVSRVWALMWPNNAASAKVALTIGMDDLGVCHDPWYGTATDPDSRMFRADVATYDLA